VKVEWKQPKELARRVGLAMIAKAICIGLAKLWEMITDGDHDFL